MTTVRCATAEDIDTIYDLINALAAYENQQQHVRTSKKELLAAGFAEQKKFGVLLAEFDGTVAGFASYTWNYSIWYGASYMNIDDVFVSEEFRGQKIGEALMHKAKEVCKERGASRIKWEVEEDNHGAIKFYKRLGADVTVKGVCSWPVEK